MSNYLAVIEWHDDDRQYSYVWQDCNGQPLPLPPIGTMITFTSIDDKFSATIRVKGISCWHNLPTVEFYIRCEMVGMIS